MADRTEQQVEGNRARVRRAGPPEPPALPHEKPRDPKSPEKSDDVHGAPATPV